MISKKADRKVKRRYKIRTRIRGAIRGSAECPRLSIFRSNKEIYAQLIDDDAGVTLASASSRGNDAIDRKGKTNTEISAQVGSILAEQAKKNKIEKAVFDRGGYLYHGRVKALADAAREGGLQF